MATPHPSSQTSSELASTAVETPSLFNPATTGTPLAKASAKRKRLEGASLQTMGGPSKVRRVSDTATTTLRANSNISTSPFYSTNLGSQVIEVVVGQAGRKFLVHKNLLSNATPVFHKILQGPFAEASAQSVELPEDSPVAFDIFIEWCYKGTLSKIDKDVETEGGYQSRIDLYCFAEKYMIADLLDPVIGQLVDSCNYQLWNLSDVQYIYANTKQGSPLRSYALLSNGPSVASINRHSQKY